MSQLRKLPSLTLLRAFERAAHHRSFKLAAEDLHVTPSAISHKIKQLEEELGVSLFERLTRAIRLTPAGKSYFRDVHRAFSRLEAGTVELLSRFGAQVLRVHLLPFFASEVLVPRLHLFHEQHPDVQLFLESAFGRSDLHPESADISVALGHGRWPGLVALPLIKLRWAPFATKELAKQISGPADLASQTLIHFQPKTDAWAQWAEKMNLGEQLDAKAQLTVDSMFSALQAAEKGLGFILAPLPVAFDRLQRSALVTPFEGGDVEISDHYHVVYRKTDEVKESVALFRDWLMDTFGDN